MSERLTDEQRASFRAYAESSMTEEDGSQCQWADYTIRLLDEAESDSAAHEETRRRLADARSEVGRYHKALAEVVGDKAHMRAALEQARSEIHNLESALRGEQGIELSTGEVVNVAQLQYELEQARRELAEAHTETAKVTKYASACDQARRDAVSLLHDKQAQLRQLSSLLSCEPGQVTERVRDVLQYANEHGLQEFIASLAIDEQTERDMQTALQPPSRPASEPAECDRCGGSGEVAQGLPCDGPIPCPKCAPAPPASVAEQAQEPGLFRCSVCQREFDKMPGDGLHVVTGRVNGVEWSGECGPVYEVEPAKPSEGDRT